MLQNSDSFQPSMLLISIIVITAVAAFIGVSSGAPSNRRRVYVLDRPPSPGVFGEIALVVVLVVLLVAGARLVGVPF
jgi:hypothetical protein